MHRAPNRIQLAALCCRNNPPAAPKPIQRQEVTVERKLVEPAAQPLPTFQKAKLRDQIKVGCRLPHLGLGQRLDSGAGAAGIGISGEEIRTFQDMVPGQQHRLQGFILEFHDVALEEVQADPGYRKTPDLHLVQRQVVDHVAAQIEVPGHRRFFVNEIIGKGDDSVQGGDGEFVDKAEVDIIAAHEERERMMGDFGDREGKEPPAAVHFGRPAPGTFKLHRKHRVAVAKVGAVEQGKAFAVKGCAIFPHAPFVGIVDHRPGNRSLGVGGQGQESIGAVQSLHRDGGIIIHEQDVGVASRLRLQKPTGEAASAAQVGVGKRLDFGVRQDVRGIAVVDDETVHMGGKFGALKILGQPAGGVFDLRFAFEGGDRQGKAAGGVSLTFGQVTRAGDRHAAGQGADLKKDHATGGVGGVVRQVDQRLVPLGQSDDGGG